VHKFLSTFNKQTFITHCVTRCRLHNKGVYFKIGLRKMMFRRSCKDLHQAVRLEVDGKLVDMPPVEGIIILNILRSDLTHWTIH